MDEITLEKGVPVQVTPSGSFTVIQNTMGTTDDPLLVSTHGDVSKKWMIVRSGGSVKFDEPVYVMQNSWKNFVFPVIEGA